MRLRILGAVELWDGSAWVSVRATRQRQLLAILLVHRGRVVDAGWLIEQLWDGRPPASASQLLPHYVWRLRRLLPDGACQLRTSPVGYALDVRTDDLDVEQFASLVDDGRGAAANGAYDRAISSLSSGLALWRGPALADARSLPALEELCFLSVPPHGDHHIPPRSQSVPAG